MSTLTDEWLLNISNNRIKYWMDILNMKKILNTSRVGREIYSKVFKIGKSEFQIKLYPNGDLEEDKGYFSVYLFNRTNWRVKVSFKTCVIDDDDDDDEDDSDGSNYHDKTKNEIEFVCRFGTANSNSNAYGTRRFLSHQTCRELISKKGSLKLLFNLEILEEEVTFSRDLTLEQPTDKIENLEKIISSLKCQLENTKSDTEGLKVLVNDQKQIIQSNSLEMQSVKSCLKDLKAVFETNLHPASTKQPQRIHLECPICMESVQPPMRLMQCGQGHIICDSCFGKLERRGLCGLRSCTVCMQDIIGRPTVLEQIMKLI